MKYYFVKNVEFVPSRAHIENCTNYTLWSLFHISWGADRMLQLLTNTRYQHVNPFPMFIYSASVRLRLWE